MKTKIAIVEFRNAGSYVYQFKTDKEISNDKWVDKIHQWLKDNEDFNECKDNFILSEVVSVELK